MKTVAMSRSRRKRAMPILMPDGHVVAKFLCVLCCVVLCVVGWWLVAGGGREAGFLLSYFPGLANTQRTNGAQ